MASLAIFTFVLTWNDYLWPLVIATEREMFTVTTGLPRCSPTSPPRPRSFPHGPRPGGIVER
jgi:ABC-type glycerol-3-phosphate transport system permease component